MMKVILEEKELEDYNNVKDLINKIKVKDNVLIFYTFHSGEHFIVSEGKDETIQFLRDQLKEHDKTIRELKRELMAVSETKRKRLWF